MQIFSREFFANEHPYDDILLNILKKPQPLLEFRESRDIKKKEEPLIKILFLSLSEVHTCTIVIRVSRNARKVCAYFRYFLAE